MFFLFTADAPHLEAGVTRPSRYEPGINRTYQELAAH